MKRRMDLGTLVIVILIVIAVLAVLGIFVASRYQEYKLSLREREVTLAERVIKLYKPQIEGGYKLIPQPVKDDYVEYEVKSITGPLHQSPAPIVNDGQGDMWRDAVNIVTESIRQNGPKLDRLIPANAWTSGGDWQAAKDAMASKGWVVSISDKGRNGTFVKDHDLAWLLAKVTTESAMRHMTAPPRETVEG